MTIHLEHDRPTPLSDLSRTTLVLGGRGKTGGRVVQRLAALGAPVRATSRSGPLLFDWEQPATWRPALAGVQQVYVTYQPDLAFPGAAERVSSLVHLAVSGGVERIVLLSGRNEEGALAAEQAVQDAGTAWTIVRASFFDQNFSEGFLLEPLLAGELAFPAGDVTEPFIDADDIADVVVAALTGDGHAGELYEVTGPRLLTFAEAVDTVAAAAGRPMRYVSISMGAFAAALGDAGLPAADVDAYTDLFHAVLDGRNTYVTDGVTRALGRPPRDITDWARATAAAGAWATPADPAAAG